MSDHDQRRCEHTRRTVFGSLTAVGVSAAGTGFGTSEYFSEDEASTNERLGAGDLDRRVIWEEHDSDRSEDAEITIDLGEETMGGDAHRGVPGRRR